MKNAICTLKETAYVFFSSSFAIVCIVVLLSNVGTVLSAQNLIDEYSFMKEYKLPNNAIKMQEMALKDSLMFYQNKAFSGTAYELSGNRVITGVTTYKSGIKHGQMLLWYNDGSPQLFSSNHYGAPNGRFLGWYPDGRIIYNLVLNRGRLSMDYNFTDLDRQEGEVEVLENEGKDND